MEINDDYVSEMENFLEKAGPTSSGKIDDDAFNAPFLSAVQTTMKTIQAITAHPDGDADNYDPLIWITAIGVIMLALLILLGIYWVAYGRTNHFYGSSTTITDCDIPFEKIP